MLTVQILIDSPGTGTFALYARLRGRHPRFLLGTAGFFVVTSQWW